MNNKKLTWNNYFSPSKDFISFRITSKINLQTSKGNQLK